MAKQQTFAGLAWQNKRKKTRRERFLAEMDAIIPWGQLLDLIEPLSEGRQGSAAAAAGEDAADLLSADLVQPV